MKKSLVLASSVALVLVSGIASAVPYKATLNGKQETPAVTTTATGTATLDFNTNNNKLTGTITLMNLAATTAQHVHRGACGMSTANNVASDGALPAPQGNDINVNIVLNAMEATELAAGGLYINVHTATNANGEIRGQIYPMASTLVCNGPNDGGAPPADAGSSGTSGASGGTSGASGASGGTSGSNGATTVPADSGTPPAEEPPAEDDSGCNTSGSSSSGSGLALAAFAILGLAVASRTRKKR
jgi:MYXO-CTERM domain-containing protein